MLTQLVLESPPGMTFQQVRAISNPMLISLWLMHDSSQSHLVLEWLDKVRDGYIAQLEAIQKAQQDAAKNVDMAAAERLAQESKAAAEGFHPTTTTVSTSTLGHDWNGPYRIGVDCKRCKVKATGFEPGCVKV